MAREFVATLDYREGAGGAEQELRPAGQPPAHDRRHRRLPHRPRLRARHHRPGRRRATSPAAARRSSCHRPDLPVLRRRQGADAQPDAARPRGRASTRPSRGRRRRRHAAVLGLRRRRRPAGLDAGLHRRPRPRRRRPQSVYVLDKSRPTQLLKEDGQPIRVDLRPGETVDAARRARHGDLRRPRALEQDPDQPDPRQARSRSRGVVARAARAARLALHPSATAVGAGAPSDDGGTLVEVARLDRSAGGDPETGRDELAASWLAADRAAGPSRRTARGPVTDAAWETLSNQAVAVAGVVYFLALLAHLVEWAALRDVPVRRPRGTVGGPVAAGRDAAADVASTREVAHRTGSAGRLGVVLTVIGAPAHLVALVARGMAADPNRVPWGNMYEFTLAGTFVVVALYLVLLPAAGALAWLGPIVVGFVLCGADGRRDLALRPGRAADRGARLLLAGHPRRLGGHRHRCLHPRRHRLGALPAQGAVDRRDAATSPGCPRSTASTGCRTGCTPSGSRCGLRGAHHRPDLGARGVVVVLELGPQGGVGVHHLGRVRRLPPRPRDRGVEGSQRRDRGAGGPGDAVVQLHRHQLLLSPSQHSYAAPAGSRCAVSRRGPTAAAEAAEEVRVVVGARDTGGRDTGAAPLQDVARRP